MSERDDALLDFSTVTSVCEMSRRDGATVAWGMKQAFRQVDNPSFGMERSGSARKTGVDR
jgi:hypothetical protein